MQYSRKVSLSEKERQEIASIIKEKGIELENNKYAGIEQMLEVITKDLLEETVGAYVDDKVGKLCQKILKSVKVNFLNQMSDPKARDIFMLYQSIVQNSTNALNAGLRDDIVKRHIINAGYICHAYAANKADSLNQAVKPTEEKEDLMNDEDDLFNVSCYDARGELTSSPRWRAKNDDGRDRDLFAL